MVQVIIGTFGAVTFKLGEWFQQIQGPISKISVQKSAVLETDKILHRTFKLAGFCRLTGQVVIFIIFFTDHCVLSGPKTAHNDSHHNSCFRLQWWWALYQCIQQCMSCGPTTFPLFILFITFCNQRNCTPCCNCNSSVMPRYSRVKCETICSTAKSWPKLNDAAGQ